MRINFVCIFLFLWGNLQKTSHSWAIPVQATTIPSTTTTNSRQLVQSAPYAIVDNNKTTGNVKNLVFKLTSNQKNERNNDSTYEPWTLINQNGTLIGSRVNLDLNKLLEALNNNNITTSEVKFNDNTLNITISQQQQHQHQSNNQRIDENFLEELMIDSNNPAEKNLTSIIRDNHKSELKSQSRSKLGNNNQRNHQINQQHQSIMITASPIRSSMEVVAENYTIRKIADEANIFALKLLNQINIEKIGTKNLIQAPFSVYQALTLLLSGATGETEKELDKVLLGSQSSYENNRLTHDQDRVRLKASLNDVINQLQLSSSHHFKAPNDTDRIVISGPPYSGGDEEQHLIVANNLLFSPIAYEISNEFKNTVNQHYNNTALTRMEVGSTESIQNINNWIRRATLGMIPALFNRKTTFDEYNVMTLLSTSWLAQEWRQPFYRISSSIRNNIRLKGQAKALSTLMKPTRFAADHKALLEFVDDDKQSHFVEYIKTQPNRNIQHYHAILNGIIVDVVVIPFKNSNHKMITLTPLVIPTSNNNQEHQQSNNQTIYSASNSDLPDSSSLSKLISIIAQNPRKVMRALWAVVAPDIVTKQSYENIQLAKHLNITVNEKIIQTTITPLVQLSMPMIRVDADSSITAALNHIGIVNAFDRDQANFIGINGHPFNYYRLHLSNVISKTTFNLDERGINYDRTINSLTPMRIYPQQQQVKRDQNDDQDISEESSGESNGNSNTNINNKDYEIEFVDEVKLNKPYVYLIGDFRTKLILYTGVMENPQQQLQVIPH